MKIAILMIDPLPLLYRIFMALRHKYGIKIRVWCQYDLADTRQGYDWQNPDGIQLIKWYSLKQYRAILKHDVLIIHGIWASSRSWLTYLLACMAGKKVINMTEAENRYTIKQHKRILKKLSVFPLPKSKTHFLCLGGFKECVDDNSKYGFPKANFHPFAYCGAVEERKSFHQKEYKSGQALQLLYAGQLIHRKGLDILFESLAALNNNSFSLQIYGKGPEEQRLKKLGKQLGIEDKLVFGGHIDTRALEKALMDADVFVLPSRFDGYGAVLNEAASYSLPLIASRHVMSHYQLIENGRNGFVFSEKEELTEILGNLVNNPFVLPAMRKASFEISKRFTPESLAEQLYGHLMNM